MRLFITGKASTAWAIARALVERGVTIEKAKGYYRIPRPAVVDAQQDENEKPLDDLFAEDFADDDVVAWCGGHLVELAPPETYGAQYKKWRLEDLPIVPTQWQWQENKKLRSGQLSVIQSLLAQAKLVVHAGDPDREGQWLIDQLLQYCQYSGQVKRLTLHNLHWRALKQAVKDFEQHADSITTDNKQYASLSLSAYARSQADWLYGLNMTRAYTLLGRSGGHEQVLSVGRVQTPLLALVVARDEAIEQFEPKTTHTLWVKFKKDEDFCYGSEALSWEITQQQSDQLEKELRNKRAELISRETQHHVLIPPLPLNLSRLQIECANRLGYSPLEVVEAAHNLYEKHHLITYPRSDCRYLPESKREQIEDVLDAIAHHLPDESHRFGLHLDESDSWRVSGCWNDQQVDIHHAIIPTENRLEKQQLSELSEQELKVYELIARYYLVQFFPDAENQEVQMIIQLEDRQFMLHWNELMQAGWQEVLPELDDPDHTPDKLHDRPLPDWQEGDVFVCEDVEVRLGKTRPPHRFSDASLISALAHVLPFVEDEAVRASLHENDGLGTNSTRAHMIDTLFKRGYLMKGNKSVYSTAIGRDLVRALPADAVKVDMTASWEKQLSAIADMPENEAQQEADSFIGEVERHLREMINSIQDKKNIHVTSADEVLGLKQKPLHCPECDSVLRKRKGKFGEFWGCSAYPQCKYTQNIS